MHDIVFLSPGHSLLENHLFYSKEVFFSFYIKRLGLFFLVAVFTLRRFWLSSSVQKSLHCTVIFFWGGEIIRRAVGIAAAQLGGSFKAGSLLPFLLHQHIGCSSLGARINAGLFQRWENAISSDVQVSLDLQPVVQVWFPSFPWRGKDLPKTHLRRGGTPFLHPAWCTLAFSIVVARTSQNEVTLALITTGSYVACFGPVSSQIGLVCIFLFFFLKAEMRKSNPWLLQRRQSPTCSRDLCSALARGCRGSQPSLGASSSPCCCNCTFTLQALVENN